MVGTEISTHQKNLDKREILLTKVLNKNKKKKEKKKKIFDNNNIILSNFIFKCCLHLDCWLSLSETLWCVRQREVMVHGSHSHISSWPENTEAQAVGRWSPTWWPVKAWATLGLAWLSFRAQAQAVTSLCEWQRWASKSQYPGPVPASAQPQPNYYELYEQYWLTQALLASGNSCLGIICGTMLLHWLTSSNARSLDQFIWLTQWMINLDTCRLSSWPLRWHYNVTSLNLF